MTTTPLTEAQIKDGRERLQRMKENQYKHFAWERFCILHGDTMLDACEQILKEGKK